LGACAQNSDKFTDVFVVLSRVLEIALVSPFEGFVGSCQAIGWQNGGLKDLIYQYGVKKGSQKLDSRLPDS
jgi:hypothetical protein